MSKLFDLFDGTINSKTSLVASEPQSLETISPVTEEQDFAIERLKRLETVDLKVDYSSFSNFVYYNSALDYFNITGEKILNEYPYDGARDFIEKFEADLDGYQRYVLSRWPKRSGHLRFNTSVSSSYVKVEDIGEEGGVSKTGLLSPGTGSFTLETWVNVGNVLTGSQSIQVLVQKVSGSNGDGYTLFLTGSSISFRMTSGSATTSVSTPISAGSDKYVAVIVDRSSFTGSMVILTGSRTEFPVTVNSSSLNIYGGVFLGGVPFYMGSGTLSGKTTQYFTGSLDDVRVWRTAQDLDFISSSFNVKQHSQRHLMAHYRFNESGSFRSDDLNKIVLDHSGKKLNGRIENYYSGLRGSGSLLSHEYPDYITSVDAPEVVEYIVDQQVSGSVFDRSNQNMITNLVPESFLVQEELRNTEVLKNFLFIMARHFDGIKLYIDQFQNVLKVGYGEYDQSPDATLDVVGKLLGWDFVGNFLNSSTFQYLLGKNVLKNTSGNEPLDVSLFEIKNKFWRRVLVNLMHLYKTKGTKESVKSLFRIYGVNDNFVRIKEFGYTPDVSLQTQRINTAKSIAALGFGSGSLTASVSVSGSGFAALQSFGQEFTVEGTFRFPLSSSADITPSSISGSLWKLISSGSKFITLRYLKDSVGSHTGSLILTSSDTGVSFTIPNVPIFDNKWHHVSVKKNLSSGSITISTRLLDNGEIVYDSSSVLTSFTGFVTGSNLAFDVVRVGSSDNLAAQYWAKEFRLWKKPLADKELIDHTLNFQSYGTTEHTTQDHLLLHWRLNENVSSSISSTIGEIQDYTLNFIHGTGSAFFAQRNPYKKFLDEYNYIASLDFGWSEDKIRIFDSSKIKASEMVNDYRIVSVEFNMIDALNEDISQMIAGLENFDNMIGMPANRYRVQYDDLRKVRDSYFKRLKGRLNFRVFSDMLEFFDRSFVEMVKRLIPARATFLGDEFVVESHILERPKIIYERRKFQDLHIIFEGSIRITDRFDGED